MITIASEVRRMFFRIMRVEIVELQDRVEVLKHADIFDDEIATELKRAYEHLYNARVRTDELIGDDS